jgi:Ca2+-binding EF-hand superfamily protein
LTRRARRWDVQERFARKNEAEDLRRAFDILDTKGRVCCPRHCLLRCASRCSPHRDGRIDADEVEQVFKQLGHKCKRVSAR